MAGSCIRYLQWSHKPTLDGSRGLILQTKNLSFSVPVFLCYPLSPIVIDHGFLLEICCVFFLAAFVRALPTVSPSISLSTSNSSLGLTGLTSFTAFSGSYLGSHAQTRYGGPSISSPLWINGPPKDSWRPPPKHRRPYVPPAPCPMFLVR